MFDEKQIAELKARGQFSEGVYGDLILTCEVLWKRVRKLEKAIKTLKAKAQ